MPEQATYSNSKFPNHKGKEDPDITNGCETWLHQCIMYLRERERGITEWLPFCGWEGSSAVPPI